MMPPGTRQGRLAGSAPHAGGSLQDAPLRARPSPFTSA
ncbi:hypothetical protein A176_005607 [Myxococcus hansupus]|uniref:Uncharacterized protein n=1 Tax=Pseudomyxococcus hansupus TaxID=1297742 RepID=A0A0H4X521_9BACT|nr:hypothetical protein A176_005607 [Myxococcus hansupus]